MIKDDIQKGKTLFLVKTNTAQDPMLCHQKIIPYIPVIVLEMDIASTVYEYETVNSDILLCFDVLGNHGTQNKGRTDGTRRVALMEIGLDNSVDDYLFPFLKRPDAEDKINDLLSKKHIKNTMIAAMSDWGVNPSQENIDVLIRLINV
jgi:hypothetical protein